MGALLGESKGVVIKQGIIDQVCLLSFLPRHSFDFEDDGMKHWLKFSNIAVFKMTSCFRDEKCCGWAFSKLWFQCSAVSWVVSEITIDFYPESQGYITNAEI